jgi:aryl-alcohol dehydrogenase-like predicted oxidoreductase
LLTRPAVASVIAGATKLEQVRANGAAGSWTLSKEDTEELDGLLDELSARRDAAEGAERASRRGDRR